MRNIDTEADRQRLTPPESAVRESATVKVRPRTSTVAKTYVMGQWDWRRLRDYVIDQIQHHHGPVDRDPLRESGIFKGFIQRWGPEQAEAIARYVFDKCDGRWANDPVTVTRFCKQADPYFAGPIAARLAEATAPS